MIAVNSPIVGPPSGSLATALDYAGTDNADYVRELYRLCALVGIDPAIMFAQAAHETADFTSFWWETRRNPAGIGITGTPAQDAASQTWANGTDAARGHVVHMCGYLYRVVPAPIMLLPHHFLSYDERLSAIDYAGYRGVVRTIADLTGKWATDPQYAEKIVSRHRAIFGTDDAGTVHSEGANAQVTYTTPIPGLPGGPLITAYPIRFNLVPATQTRNRPGIPAKSPRRSIQHGNGNPNALAAADARYLYNGADGRQASYHATSDDTEVWICIPLDEVTWQAADGAGPGNMNGLSLEMSEYAGIRNDDARLDRAITVAADFMGRCSARLTIAKPERHWDFNADNPPSERHHCPDMLMSDTLNGRSCWDIYAERWQAAKADELARMNPQPKPVPATPQPAPIWWEPGWVGLVKRPSDGHVANAMLVQTYATTTRAVPVYDQIGGKKIGEIDPGKPAVIVGTTRDDKGRGWNFVKWGDDPARAARARASSFQDKLPLP